MFFGKTKIENDVCRIRMRSNSTKFHTLSASFENEKIIFKGEKD